jgi:hypothetical protein
MMASYCGQWDSILDAVKLVAYVYSFIALLNLRD